MSKMPNWARAAIISLVIILLPLIWGAIYSGNNNLQFMFSVLIVVLLADFASVVLGKIITNDIDLKYLISEDNGNASLSRFQFLLFTFVIAASYFLFVAGVIATNPAALVKDGNPIPLPNIPSGVLGLIGISGGSYVVAKAIQKSADAGSSVVRVTVTSAGAGYATPPTITFTGGGGMGAQATAALDAAGGVSRIDVTTPGSGYTAAPTVQIAGGGGAGATAVSVIG